MNYLNKMEHFKKEILKTTDGSNTIYIPEMDETYHSHHGALAESKHIFIETGLLLAMPIIPHIIFSFFFYNF